MNSLIILTKVSNEIIRHFTQHNIFILMENEKNKIKNRMSQAEAS